MKILAGYVSDRSDWSWQDPHLDKLSHLNYAFALVADKQGTVVENFQKARDLARLKERHPRLITSLSIGGWGAGNFSEAAESPAGRRQFAESALAVVEKYGFQGLDIDWEYPCVSGGGISSHPEDRVNFTLLLQALREASDRLSQKSGRPYLLTIAAGAHPSYLEGVEVERIVQILDLVYLMTYDLGSESHVTGHHANLYYSARTPRRLNADQSVQAFLQSGVPAEKLVLGLPFYGRAWSGVEKRGDGLNCRVYGERGRYFDYRVIKNELLPAEEYRRYWDEQAKAPFLFNGDSFISYEDPQSIGEKVGYLKTRGLAGAMFWEYALDYQGELLGALHEGLG